MNNAEARLVGLDNKLRNEIGRNEAGVGAVVLAVLALDLVNEIGHANPTSNGRSELVFPRPVTSTTNTTAENENIL